MSHIESFYNYLEFYSYNDETYCYNYSHIAVRIGSMEMPQGYMPRVDAIPIMRLEPLWESGSALRIEVLSYFEAKIWEDKYVF